jgi:hypothetical protein
MSGFVGADVDQLDALAAAFDRRSAAFTRIAADSSRALTVAEWTGGDVDRVRSEWNRQARPAMLRISTELSELATDLRRQANQQRESSGGRGVDGGVYLPWPGLPGFISPWWIPPADLIRRFPELSEVIRVALTAGGMPLDGKDLIAALGAGDTLNDVFAKLPDLKVGTVLSLVGMGFSANDLGVALGENDEAGVLGSGLDLVMGGIGIFVPGAGLAWEGGKLIGETGYNAFQSVHDTEDGALRSAAEDMFGRGTDLNNLTSEQATALAQRYEGPLGVCASISDSMRGLDRDFRRAIGLDW